MRSQRSLVFPSGAAPQTPQKRVTIDGLSLGAGWYRLSVAISGTKGLVSATIRSADPRRPPLSLKLESGEGGRFAKILKISEPVISIALRVDGKSEGVTKVEARRLGVAAVFGFMAAKCWRYIRAKRGRLNPLLVYRKALSMLRPNANFAFRAHYHLSDADAYPRWRSIHEDAASGMRAASELGQKFVGPRLRIALIVADNIDPVAAAESVRASVIMSRIELIAVSAANSAAGTDEILAATRGCDFLIPYDRLGAFAHGGVEQLLLPLVADPSLLAAYADSDCVGEDKCRSAPRLKPPWDRELLWCTDYIRMPLAVRWRPEALAALTLPGASRKPGYAMAITLLEMNRSAVLTRVPEVLFHEAASQPSDGDFCERGILDAYLKRHNIPAAIRPGEGPVMRVDWSVPRDARVSILIPTRDNPGLLKSCIESIRLRTVGIDPEIVVADNGSVRDDTKAYFETLTRDGLARVVPCPGPFNFSKINNDARRHLSGDVIVLLNDDTQVVSPEWLTELVGLASRPEVGAVGALLIYPDGTVQHAGVVLGIAGAPADHAFRHAPGDSPGYLDLLRCRRETSAVTGACLAVSARHFDEVGGLDESLPVTLNDVDFCLRLRDRGLVNIWTPWAVLEHAESKSRGIDYTEAALTRLAGEIAIFSSRWQHLVDRDPNYHPALSDLDPNYRLAV